MLNNYAAPEDFITTHGNVEIFKPPLLTKESTTYSAAELQKMEFPPIKYIVRDYIPEGLTIFAGKPKIGKSWACLDIALAVSTGGRAFGNIECEKGAVLYLALEDNKRRLQSRFKKIRRDNEWPKNLELENTYPKLGEGGFDKIKTWIETTQDARLIIIDTLAKVRGGKKENDTLYEADYKAVEGLQKLAGEKGIAIILVHHVRKMEAEDPLDTVSGTTGLTGAADTILVLNRLTNNVFLYARGRDIEEIQVAVEFDKTNFIWRVLGEASEVRMSNERRKIIEVLKKERAPMKPREIADELFDKANNIKQLLRKMLQSGEVVKSQIKTGAYELPEKPITSITQ